MLWRNLIKANYTPTSNKNQSLPSSAKEPWKYIKKHQNLITNRTFHRVGDGGSTSFWDLPMNWKHHAHQGFCREAWCSQFMGRSRMMCSFHHPPYGEFDWWWGFDVSLYTFKALFVDDEGDWFLFDVGVYLAFIRFLLNTFSSWWYLHIYLAKRALFFFIKKRSRPPFSVGRFIILRQTSCGPSFYE